MRHAALHAVGCTCFRQVTNVVPHVANFQLVVRLIQNLKNMKPQLAIVLSGTCAAKNETCVSTPAKLELDVDYYFKHHLTRFTDKVSRELVRCTRRSCLMRCLLVRNVAWPTQGTAKITLSVAFNAALEMNPDGKWALNTDDKITMAIDGHSLSHARTHAPVSASRGPTAHAHCNNTTWHATFSVQHDASRCVARTSSSRLEDNDCRMPSHAFAQER